MSMDGFALLFFLTVFPAAFLAVIPAAIEKSAKTFGIAFVKSLLGIVLPFWAFLASLAIGPIWKGACSLGWVTCFHWGKIWLFPLVVWALAGLYFYDVYRPRRENTWIVLGIFNGAIVSTVCFVHGLFSIHPFSWGLIIPFYTCLWFTLRAVGVMRNSKLTPLAYAWTVLGSIPFWAVALYQSYRAYLVLPEEPPRCFVVTAASRGHRAIVGVPRSVERGGRMREANLQLLVFWEFERLWRKRLPLSHRLFRVCYNRIGPLVARRMRNPYLADAVYLILKPAEWGARMVLSLFG